MRKPSIEFQMAVVCVGAAFLGLSTGNAVSNIPLVRDILTMPYQTDCFMKKIAELHQSSLAAGIEENFQEDVKFALRRCTPA